MNNVEWSHAKYKPVVADEDELPEPIDPDEIALWLGSDGANVLYGTPQQIVEWATDAINLVNPIRLGDILHPGVTCGHCRKQQLGSAMAGGVPLCHSSAEPDCYRLVTVYGHSADGSCCEADDAEPTDDASHAEEERRIAAERHREAG